MRKLGRGPSFKKTILIVASLSLVYYILAGVMICHAAGKSLAGESSSDMPVILIIAAAVLIGCGVRTWGAVKKWRGRRAILRRLDHIRAMRGRV